MRTPSPITANSAPPRTRRPDGLTCSPTPEAGGRGPSSLPVASKGEQWKSGRWQSVAVRRGQPSMSDERQLEDQLNAKLRELKYVHRTDIRDRAALEDNFRQKFQELNRVKLTDAEFDRLFLEIVTADVFAAAKTLRGLNSFTRDDGTPLNYTLVNIDDWCKNTYEVVNQLRINTDYSHHRYDVLLLINGVPVAQVELKPLGINPRRAIEQIVEYKNDHRDDRCEAFV